MTGIEITICVLLACGVFFAILLAKAKPFNEEKDKLYNEPYHYDSDFDSDQMIFMH